ncbi:MAG: hypothetical protein MK320_12075 [Gammaproteobacteria bacterium]|nr:hypothetical protein [Gammaproteobacteria bacterium]
MLKPNHQGPGDDILALMKRLTPYKLLLVALTCLIIQGCGGGTSSGTLLQEFNVEGRWTGTMSNLDGTRLIPLSMTLMDVDGTVTGVVLAPEYECVTSGVLTNGTATQTREGTGGDDPLTLDNEMSTRGTLTIDWAPTSGDGGSPARPSLITINLLGTSSDLTGNYTGYWNRDTETPCGTATITPTEQVEGVMTLSRS